MSIARVALIPLFLIATSPVFAQSTSHSSSQPVTSLRVDSRAVLLDVLVTDHKGVPITGLAKDAFTVVEQGKAQTVGYFEEHKGALAAEPQKQVQKVSAQQGLPANTFSNASESTYTEPADAAVANVLLLDTLNTQMADQMAVRKAADAYLKDLKPGSRLGIYTLGMRLRYVQGVSDDPALLATALGYRKVGVPDAPTLLHMPGTVAFQDFIGESAVAERADRTYRTLDGLKELAGQLGRLPGRKNLIWLAGSFPLDPNGITGVPTGAGNLPGDARYAADIKDTFAALASARVAVYPVDARGVQSYDYFTAGSGASGSQASSPLDESVLRESEYATMDLIAEKTGGKAFRGDNSLSSLIGKVVANSGYFYTLSYTPSNANADGTFRQINVAVEGGKYNLSYRRGYFARLANPAGAKQAQQSAGNETAPDDGDAKGFSNSEAATLLEPFMSLGLPQVREIGYSAVVQPANEQGATGGGTKKAAAGAHYSVDFSINLKDLKMAANDEGIYHSTIDYAIVVYNRYGQPTNRIDRNVTLEMDEEKYAEFAKEGVKVHSEIDAPKGEYWLRTGVYDRTSHHIGTLEIPLGAIVAMK